MPLSLYWSLRHWTTMKCSIQAAFPSIWLDRWFRFHFFLALFLYLPWMSGRVDATQSHHHHHIGKCQTILQRFYFIGVYFMNLAIRNHNSFSSLWATSLVGFSWRAQKNDRARSRSFYLSLSISFSWPNSSHSMQTVFFFYHENPKHTHISRRFN